MTKISYKDIYTKRKDSIFISDIVCEKECDIRLGLEHLNEIIHGYGYATVADCCDVFDLTCDYIHNMYGWKEPLIIGVNTQILFDCSKEVYILKLPEAHRRTNETEGADKSVDKSDMVNHPNHYKSETGIECIDAIEAATFDLKGIEAVDTANVLKYIWRWKRKNGLEDLKKARWYLDNLIDHVEKNAEGE